MNKRSINVFLDNNKYKYIKNYPISKMTTIGLGGIAAYVVYPLTIKELVEVILFCRNSKIKFEILGNGSNVLFSDKTYKGIIISLNYLSRVYKNDNYIYTFAGVKLPYLSYYAMQNEIINFETFSLIPGSVGASLCINAGAYGKCIGDVVESVVVLNETNEIKLLKKEELNFSYRDSNLKNEKLIVLLAIFKIEKGNKYEIKSKMDLYAKLRQDSQPLYERNFGSLFKNPNDTKVYKIIRECGLSDYSYKGVRLSKKHSNFLQISTNNCAKDVLYFIENIRKKVYNKIGILLDNEVILKNWREKDVKRIKRTYK